MLLALSLFSAAYADDCVNGDAPFTYSTYSCDDECVWLTDGGGEYISCTPDNAAVQWTGVVLYAASNYAGTGADYSFWGTDTGGNKFCCAFENVGNNQVEGILLNGTSYDDTIYASDATGTEYLYNPVSYQTLVVDISGGAGDDELYGTRDGTDLDQYIDGDDDDDRIECFVDSHVEGGLGQDTIIGSSAGDTIYGDLSSSSSTGDADEISGGAGTDYIYGGGGGDLVCGQVGIDYLYGGSGSDTLLGGLDTDHVWGGNGGIVLDYCIAEDENECEADPSPVPACPS